MKLKKFFLILAVVGLVVGFSDARPSVFFYLGRPVGAISFGMYLILRFFEKESALFDEQNRAAGLEQRPPARGRGPVETSRPAAAAGPGFDAAHAR